MTFTNTFELIILLMSILMISSYLYSGFHLLIGLIVIASIFVLKAEELFLIYIFIIIWNIEIFSGINQIPLILFEIFLIINIAKGIKSTKNILIYKAIFLLTIFIYFVISILYNTEFSSLKILLPFIIFFLTFNFINKDISLSINKISIIYLISINIAIVYGYLGGNFSDIRMVGETTQRFWGVHAPNYMAFYLNIGFVFLLYTFKKNILYLLFLTNMFIALLLTQSTSGIFVFSIIISIRVISFIKSSYKRRSSFLIFSMVCLLISMLALFTKPLIAKVSNIGAMERLLSRVSNNNFSINDLTNDRFSTWVFYIEEFKRNNFFEKLFGNAITNTYEYFLNVYSSVIGTHNTYLEILFFNGVIGLVIFVIFQTFQVYTAYLNKDLEFILSIKIVLLLTMISTSLFSNKLFYFLMFFAIVNFVKRKREI